eukprot:746116-Hanusia_phi.AAC.3
MIASCTRSSLHRKVAKHGPLHESLYWPNTLRYGYFLGHLPRQIYSSVQLVMAASPDSSFFSSVAASSFPSLGASPFGTSSFPGGAHHSIRCFSLVCLTVVSGAATPRPALALLLSAGSGSRARARPTRTWHSGEHTATEGTRSSLAPITRPGSAPLAPVVSE